MTTTRFKKKATGLIAVFFAVAGLCLSPLNVLAADVGTPDEETYYSIVIPDGNVSQESVDRANELLNALPEGLLENFVNDGWSIYVTDKDIDSTFFGGQYGSVMGATLEDLSAIYIEQRSKAIEESTIHEFGHYVDDTEGYLSDTPEFAQIYNTESAAFVSAFNVNFYYDVHEFWADGFYRYYDGERDALQRSCPQLYAYIENTVNSLC